MSRNRIIFLLGLSVAVLVLIGLGLPAISVLTEGRQTGFFGGANTYTKSISYTNPLGLKYNITEVQVNNHGASLLKSGTNSTVELQNVIQLPANGRIRGFTENSSVPVGGSITYQLTTDYDNWYYFDGTDWAKVGDCTSCSNTAELIDNEIKSLPIITDGLKLKAILTAGDVGTPRLQSVEIEIEGLEPILSQRQLSWISALEVSACHDDDDDDLELRDDSAEMCKGTSVDIDVLSNDSGPINPSDMSIKSGPTNGTATIDSITGAVTYVPEENFVGICYIY